MARCKGSAGGHNQQVVLPSYQLDSNLVLLPGIIYNVTFSRFKAAALLSRFQKQITNVPLIENLLSEYDFSGEDHADNGEDKTDGFTSLTDDHPGVLSAEAINGIKQFYHHEQAFKKNQDSANATDAQPQSEFDWLVLAISPNLSKIKEPGQVNLAEAYGDIVTVVRIVGVIDDTTNVKITLQALTRGKKIASHDKSRGAREVLVNVDWNGVVDNIGVAYEVLNSNVRQLFKAIDSFIVDYRQVLSASGGGTAAGSANQSNTKARKNAKFTEKDLLTLNPLANALYLQVAGSKDFTKAYVSLQKLFGNFTISSSSAPGISNLDSKNFLRLIDLISAIIPFPNHEKLNILNQFEISHRIDHVNMMMKKLVVVFQGLKENTQFINHWFYNEATNIQRANVVANQLKSIRLVLEGMTSQSKSNGGATHSHNGANQNKKLVRRRPSGLPSTGTNTDASGTGAADDDSNNNGNSDDDEDENDDELRAITNFIKNKLPTITTLSNDSKRLIVKDYKRVKNSPPGNSDFHVLRNYLEIVADLPWDRYVGKFDSNKDIDLALAKRQLDEDHYGLEHVKARLIQYLVVLKLLGMNAEVEVEQQHQQQRVKLDQHHKQQQEQQESKKFTRDRYSNESIIIPNNDETSLAHRHATNENKKSRELTQRIKRKELEQQQEHAKLKLVSQQNKSPIIMLAGPPGVGKTSLARSIASVLGREFQRVSLGGIKDESEIRGHRRTYVGAMPGVIVQSLRKSGSMNPVILLDEIDKVVGGASGGGAGGRVNGDPAAALLEVLDPEQNGTFTDHYLGFPVDLSQVMFICTANEPHNLSRPLLDRLEMIELGAYDYSEKLIIGQRYLLPRQLKRNGLARAATDKSGEALVQISNDVLKKVVLDYTREAGVRNFERCLGAICRHKAVDYAESLNPTTSTKYVAKVEEYDLARYLGVPYPQMSQVYDTPVGGYNYGVVNGLSYNSDGTGSVLVFESIGLTDDTSSNGPTLNMTGRLGDVLMESGKIGLTFIKSIIMQNILDDGSIDHAALVQRMNQLKIHMHVPSGSISKDGPSAGITMALANLSLILQRPVSTRIAMTGEITLRGLVLPIGGLKEKMLGASLSGLDKLIVPRENRKDVIEEYVRSINQPAKLNQLLRLNDAKDEVADDGEVEKWVMRKYGVEVVYARTFWDVIRGVWGDSLLVKVEQAKMVEYHL